MDGEFIEQLTGRQADEVARQVLDVFRDLPDGISILKRKGWVAAPLEFGADMPASFRRRIARCAESRREPNLLVVRLPAADRPAVAAYRTPTAASALKAVSEEMRLDEIVLTAPGFSWFLYLSEAEFSIAVGEPSAVLALLNAPSVEAAVSGFGRYLDCWTHVPAHLESIAAAGWATFADLADGDRLVIEWP